jgi:hypothetical protein
MQRVVARHPSAELTRLPQHIRPFAEYMRLREAPTTRDIVKAYVLTRSSVQRSAIGLPKICAAYPGYAPLRRMASTGKVRPEDVMAQLLFTPEGKRYLDAAEEGHFDAHAAKVLADRMACFGLVYPRAGRDLSDPKVARANEGLFINDLRRGAKIAAQAPEIREALELPPKSYWRFVEKNVYGVSASKAGFFAALLGRGDIPTFDAREIELWQRRGKKKLEPKWADVEKLTQRFDEFPMALEAEHEPFRAHLVHHALWDAYSPGARPSKTTHGSIIRAMQFAGKK